MNPKTRRLVSMLTRDLGVILVAGNGGFVKRIEWVVRSIKIQREDFMSKPAVLSEWRRKIRENPERWGCRERRRQEGMNQGLALLLFEEKEQDRLRRECFFDCVYEEKFIWTRFIIIPQSRGVKEETVYQHSTHSFMFLWNRSCMEQMKIVHMSINPLTLIWQVDTHGASSS